MKFTKANIDDLEKETRIRLINSISGYKSANLIGSRDKKGNENVAIFSSVTHYGSAPAVLGITFRPPTSSQHTYSNIKSCGYYTINQVHSSIYEKAHMTSGKYARDESEFGACGLNPEYSETFTYAPFVKESHIKIAMKYCEEHLIKINGTILVIGEIEEIHIENEKQILKSDGSIDHPAAKTATISGIDTYLHAQVLDCLPRVKN